MLLAKECSLLHISRMMTPSDLTKRVRALADASGASASTLSRKLFGNGSRLDEIERGGDITARVMERAVERLIVLEHAAADTPSPAASSTGLSGQMSGGTDMRGVA